MYEFFTLGYLGLGKSRLSSYKTMYFGTYRNSKIGKFYHNLYDHLN